MAKQAIDKNHCEACDDGHEVPCTCTTPKRPFAARPSPLKETLTKGHCHHCKTAGVTPLRIEGLCKDCYILLYINPIKTEISRNQEIRVQLEDSLYQVMVKLQLEEKVHESGGPKVYRCKRCDAKFTQQLFLMWHEENDCTAPPKASQPRAKRAGKPAPASQDSDDWFD